MNKDRRQRLDEAVRHLETASDIILDAMNEEQSSMDNMPENMQDGERYQRMEEAVDHLEDALDEIADASRSIVSAQSV